MALFLLKRSGYDPSSMITTISLLDMNKDDEGIMTVLSQAINTHPLIDNRVSSLQDNIFKFEKTFQSKYEVSPLPDPSLFYRVLKLFHLVFRVSSNKHIFNLILFSIDFSIISPSLFYSPLLSPSFHHPYSFFLVSSNKHTTDLTYTTIHFSKSLFNHHFLRDEPIAHLFIQIISLPILVFLLHLPLHPLELVVIRPHVQLRPIHARHARLHDRLGEVHAVVPHADVRHASARAQLRPEQRREEALRERGALARSGGRGKPRRDGEIALEEEEEEVHDGHDAAGLLVVVDADERGGVSLRKHEKEAGKRLVRADGELRAERLELRVRREHREVRWR